MLLVGREAVFVVVGVLVVLAVAVGLHEGGDGVAEVEGDGERAVFADGCGGGGVGAHGGVGFGRAGEVDGGLGEDEGRFGHADEVDGLLGGDGEGEGAGVGEADVFGGADDEAAGGEHGVFAGFEQAGEPIDGGVGVGAADGFDHGGDDVVVGVAGFVVGEGALGDFGEAFGGDAAAGGAGVGDGEFEGVEGDAGVAAAELDEGVEGVVVDFHLLAAEAAFGVGEGALEESADVFGGEGIEAVDAGAGEERGDDFEGGVFGGGADEADDAVFHGVEDGVLLGFVEAVDFVDEEDGGEAGVAAGGFGAGEDAANIGDAAGDGGEGFEAGVDFGGEGAGDAGLAAAGRSPEDAGVGRAEGGLAAEGGVGREHVGLTDDVVERARAHAGGEGRAGVGGGVVVEHAVLEGWCAGHGARLGNARAGGASPCADAETRVASALLSDRIRRMPATAADYRQRLISQGCEEGLADVLVEMVAARDGLQNGTAELLDAKLAEREENERRFADLRRENERRLAGLRRENERALSELRMENERRFSELRAENGRRFLQEAKAKEERQFDEVMAALADLRNEIADLGATMNARILYFGLGIAVAILGATVAIIGAAAALW